MRTAGEGGESEPIACVQLERNGTEAYLGMFTVRAVNQQQGLGKRLLAAAETFVKERWQASSLVITVIVQRTELISWYERRGFVSTSERKAFPYDDPRCGQPLRDDLEFIEMKKMI